MVAWAFWPHRHASCSDLRGSMGGFSFGSWEPVLEQHRLSLFMVLARNASCKWENEKAEGFSFSVFVFGGPVLVFCWGMRKLCDVQTKSDIRDQTDTIQLQLHQRDKQYCTIGNTRIGNTRRTARDANSWDPIMDWDWEIDRSALFRLVHSDYTGCSLDLNHYQSSFQKPSFCR